MREGERRAWKVGEGRAQRKAIEGSLWKAVEGCRSFSHLVLGQDGQPERRRAVSLEDGERVERREEGGAVVPVRRWEKAMEA